MSPIPKKPIVTVSNEQDPVYQDMLRRQEYLREQFSALEKENMRELSQDLFVQNFLPYFCGEMAVTKEVLAAWNAVAGSPFSPVNIINNHQVVATVPALTDISVVKTLGRRDSPMNANAIGSRAEMTAHLNPRGAQLEMAQSLNNRFNSVRNSPSQGAKEAWEKLLNYFGKSLVPAQAKQNSQVDEEF